MSKNSARPKRVTGAAPAPPASDGRSLYVSAPAGVLGEIDGLLRTEPLSRARFLGRLLELGLQEYKREKGLAS